MRIQIDIPDEQRAQEAADAIHLLHPQLPATRDGLKAFCVHHLRAAMRRAAAEQARRAAAPISFDDAGLGALRERSE